MIDPTRKSAFRQFFHQVTSGSEDEKSIEKVLRDLEQGKTSLIIAIQVVAVGFGKDKQGNNYVNSTSARRVDDFLRNRLGHDKGLKVMGLIEDHGQGGRVSLSEDDLDNLGSLIKPFADEETIGTERRILNNVTQFQALQSNAPVGRGIWAHIDRLVIENNRAAGLSTQVNYPITMDIFYALLVSKLGVVLLVFCVLYFPIAFLFGREHKNELSHKAFKLL